MSDRIPQEPPRELSVNIQAHEQLYIKYQFKTICLYTGRQQIIVFTIRMTDGRLEVYNQERIWV
jgi:hypothetical protein